jgi:hypothetical protein
VTDIRPPGIYSEPPERTRAPITLGRSGVPGFVGLAERGPTDSPVRITSVPRFREVFGELPEGFLAPAVEAFFRNGGRECRVVRVAHRVGRSSGEPAARATTRLADRGGAPALEVTAASPGRWGNAVSVTARMQPPRAQTFLTLDAAGGATEATIRSTHGFRPGVLVRLYNDEGEAWRTVRAVEGKSLRWEADAPLPAAMAASAPTYVETVEFELLLAAPFRKERFADLSLDPGSPEFVERVVSSRSVLAEVRVLRSATPVPRNVPADAVDVALAGGRDGLENVTPDDFMGLSSGPGERSGLAVLEAVEDIDLLAIPDLMWLFLRHSGSEGLPFSTLKDVEVVQDAMLAQCERLQDRLALLDSPFPANADRTREYRLMFDSAYGALYFPWIVVGRRGKRLAVPPCGHVAGVIARCDEMTGVHRPPANEILEDAEDLAVALRDEDVGSLNAEGINCVRTAGGRGIRVWGARTVSSDPALRYVNVRRVLNALNRAMDTHLQWVVFEPNVPSLWKTVSRNVTQFLMDLWRKGYFTGATPEEGFYVKCDDETNPPAERDAGRMTVEVGVAPVRPAEYVVLRVAQEMQESGAG